MSPRGLYWGVISNVAGNLLMLAATIWLTRVLAPDEFGEFRVGANFALLMIPFLALGAERLISRRIQVGGESRDSVASVIAAAFFVVFLGVAFLLVGYPLFSGFVFSGNIGVEVYFLSVLLIPITIAYNISNTIWRHFEDPVKAQVHLNFTQRVLRAPLLLGVSWLWPSAVSAALSMMLAQAISLFQIRGNFFRFPSIRFFSFFFCLKSNFKEMLLIGVPVAIMASVDRLDVLLINALMGVEDAGRYDLIFMMALTAMFPAMAISKSAEPFLYALAGSVDKQAGLRRLQHKAFWMSLAAVFGVAVGAPILMLFLGNAKPDFAYAVVALSIGIACSSAYGPVFEYLQVNGRISQALVIVVLVMTAFLGFKYLAASSGSLVVFSALAGMFYLALRVSLAVYIYVTDGVAMVGVPLALGAISFYLVVMYFVFCVEIPQIFSIVGLVR